MALVGCSSHGSWALGLKSLLAWVVVSWSFWVLKIGLGSWCLIGSGGW